jgi:hypothetical protein
MAGDHAINPIGAEMLSPAAPATIATMDFPTFLNTVMVEGGPRATRGYSLDHGVDEEALVRYANGAVSVSEREEIQALIGRCAWARQFVIANIKQQRRKRSAA